MPGYEVLLRQINTATLYVGAYCIRPVWAHISAPLLRLQEKYGKALLCVRYRYDDIRGVKLKTVELIVDEKPLLIPRFKDDDMVPVSVAYDEQELRDQLRKMRVRWDGQIKLWFVRYGLVRGTELETRIAAR